ncbi:LysR family transcriptional regulator [Candidimonas nitroreducens]|nr:LysR family transcriptional regulator [Candidimonas nitroreducens]
MISSRIAQLRIKHLALLDIIADRGSLREAAKVLCVTQPAVTSMLKDMESLLQVSLVERGQHGAKLTTEGVIARDRLTLVLNALQGLEDCIRAPNVKEHLRVGALSLAMLEMLPAIICKVRARRPDITIELQEGTVDGIIEGVMNGQLDCAIGRLSDNFHQEHYDALFVRPVSIMPLKAVCSVRNPIARERTVTLKQLRNQAWILLPKGTASRETFERAFIQQGLQPPAPAIESFSWLSNFHLAASSELVTVATAIAVDRFVQYGLVSAIDIRWPVKLPPIVFFCRKEAVQLGTVKIFHEELKRTFTNSPDVKAM